MRKKNEQVGKYWKHDHPLFSGYKIDADALTPFNGNHPGIVKSWLANEAEKSFQPSLEHAPTIREKKHRLAMKLEKLFGWELTKKHFRKIN
jgi:hypothetical protein